MSDARRYAVWPEPRSRSRSLKGSRPWTNFLFHYFLFTIIFHYFTWNGPKLFVDLDWPTNASSPLSASAELLVCHVKSLVDRSLLPVAGCPRSHATLLWVRWLTWVVDGACDRPPTSHLRPGSRGSGESGGHWSFLMNYGSWREAIPVRCVSVADSVIENSTIKF